MQPVPRRLALALVLSIVAAAPTSAQQWSGWARCQITVTGPGYTEQQTHTWTIAASAPTMTGAFRVYQGTWTVVGGGSLQRTQGSQTLVARWSINTPGMSAPIAAFVRASDGQMLIQARHSQLRGTLGVQGYQQLIIGGKSQKPAAIGAESFEWRFPDVVPTRPNANATLVANGSSTSAVKGSAGYMQPAGSQGTAACTWQFTQGAPPSPPSTVTAPPVPVPPI